MSRRGVRLVDLAARKLGAPVVGATLIVRVLLMGATAQAIAQRLAQILDHRLDQLAGVERLAQEPIGQEKGTVLDKIVAARRGDLSGRPARRKSPSMRRRRGAFTKNRSSAAISAPRLTMTCRPRPQALR